MSDVESFLDFPRTEVVPADDKKSEVAFLISFESASVNNKVNKNERNRNILIVQ